MDEDELKRRTKLFGLRVIKLVTALQDTVPAKVIGGQLVRAGASVGGNYRAACRGRSKAEFIAKLGVVDVHPEIILDATIGGIENAIFPEAHCSDIIETRATSRVAPDGMAPIIDESFRHRCERHSAPPL